MWKCSYLFLKSFLPKLYFVSKFENWILVIENLLFILKKLNEEETHRMLPRRPSTQLENLVQSTVKEIAKCYLHQQKEAPKNRTWINVEKPSERDLEYFPKPKCYSYCLEVGPKTVLTPSESRHANIAGIASHKT